MPGENLPGVSRLPRIDFPGRVPSTVNAPVGPSYLRRKSLATSNVSITESRPIIVSEVAPVPDEHVPIIPYTGSNPPATPRAPKVFLSFKHNRPMIWLANLVKKEMQTRHCIVERLLDDQRLAVNMRKQIEARTEWADCVFMLYSPAARNSPWVDFEYKTAKRLNKPIGLVLVLNARPPPGWDPGDRYVNLRGVNFRSRLLSVFADPWIQNQPALNTVISQLAELAVRARNGTWNLPM